MFILIEPLKNPGDRLTPKASRQKAYQIQEGGWGEGG